MTNQNHFEFSEHDEFTLVCKINDLKEKEGKRFFINNVEIAVFMVDGGIYALSNICPHQQSVMIYDGFIENGCVACPSHGWMFDLKTGMLPTKSRGLETFPVKIIDGSIYVRVKEKKFNW
jgi:nitrite reductase/ring-hydroxylating ferredoxin subunit